MKLQGSKRSVEYSQSETEILGLIPRGKAVTIDEIVKKRYGANPPYHGRSSIHAAIRSLTEKSEIKKDKFRICKSKRAGPHPIKIWIEAR